MYYCTYEYCRCTLINPPAEQRQMEREKEGGGEARSKSKAHSSRVEWGWKNRQERTKHGRPHQDRSSRFGSNAKQVSDRGRHIRTYATSSRNICNVKQGLYLRSNSKPKPRENRRYLDYSLDNTPSRGTGHLFRGAVRECVTYMRTPYITWVLLWYLSIQGRRDQGCEESHTKACDAETRGELDAAYLRCSLNNYYYSVGHFVLNAYPSLSSRSTAEEKGEEGVCVLSTVHRCFTYLPTEFIFYSS